MRITLFLLLISSGLLIFSQESSIYSEVKDSIIYLEHEIYLDKSKSKYPELFKIIEERSEKEILNSYLTVKSGSGFIITKDGYALTNRHVIHFKNLDLIRGNIGYDFAKSFLESHGEDFTKTKKDQFIADFIKLTELGKHRFIAIIDNVEYEVDIIEVANDSEPDIGLIKLKNKDSLKPIKLAKKELIEDSIIGKEVFSFGFPLGSTMDLIFEDRVVTMNRGNISALRNDELSIQHNAAISSGNSGGPLVDKDRIVYGINTASITEGNSLYYSVDSGQVRTFLEDKGYSNILKWNDRIYDTTVSNLRYNPLGEIESSSTLFVHTEENSEVYINDEYIGETPLYYTLTDPLTEIRIDNGVGEFKGKLRLINGLTTTTNLSPKIEKKKFMITITSGIEDNVKVYADDMFLGETPLMARLNQGEYALKFKSEKFFYKDRTLKVTNRDETINLKGKPGFNIKISGLEDITSNNENKNREIILGNTISSDIKSFNFNNSFYKLSYPIGESLLIPEGDYTLTIHGVYGYEGRDIPVSITRDKEFNIKEIAGSGALEIIGIPDDASIISNGEFIRDINNNKIDLPLGLNNIYIWKSGYQPFTIDITVKSDNSAFITYHKKLGHDRRGMIWGATSLLLAGSGIALYNLIDINEYAMDNSQTYDGYLDIQNKLGTTFSTLIITGTLAAIPAVFEYMAHLRQMSKYRTLKGTINE